VTLFLGLPSITVDSAGWGVSGFLFLVLVSMVTAVWKTINEGNWVRREEHERTLISHEKLEKKNEEKDAKIDKLQETVWRLSQTNTVAVARAVGKEAESS